MQDQTVDADILRKMRRKRRAWSLRAAAFMIDAAQHSFSILLENSTSHLLLEDGGYMLLET